MYRATGITYNNENNRVHGSYNPNQLVYFLGKTGSESVDHSTSAVDWQHPGIIPMDAELIAAEDTRARETFTRRLGYQPSKATTLQSRRKEIAEYARKLVWVESIDMLDSKNAGNCLPGTIQFSKEIGLSCPSNWQSFKTDSRLLLRKWKQSGYSANRLLLPAIDKAVARVRQSISNELISVVAFGYVPSCVK
jgi:hypothetical protein